MKKIKVAICLLLSMTNILRATSVIFLEGSSRSGKSSICMAIKQYHNYEAISSLYLYYCHDVFNKLAPKEFACISAHIDRENITHAITKNIFIFKQNVTEEQKSAVQQAVRSIQNYYHDSDFCDRHMEKFSAFALATLQKHLNDGFHVLADASWYITPEALRKINPQARAIRVLAYCPFSIIIERILHRNKISLETDNVMNYRFFREPLTSFESLYDLNTESVNAIDTLEKTTFLAYLDEIAKYLPDIDDQGPVSEFIMEDFTQKQLLAYRTSFLNKFEDNEVLYVVPKKTYDLVLRTNNYTPHQCAEQIVMYVEHN